MGRRRAQLFQTLVDSTVAAMTTFRAARDGIILLALIVGVAWWVTR
jgi:hypothetical protein